MNYIFKRKFHISELVNVPVEVKKILIAEPESYVCALFAYHLTSQDYFVKSCGQLDSVHRHLEQFAPHVLVVNPAVAGTAGQAVRLLEQVKRDYPALLIVTVGFDSPGPDLKHLMAAGVNAHVDRKFTKPQDVVTIVHSLLSNH